MDRYDHGRAVLDAVDGTAGAKGIDSLKDRSDHSGVYCGFPRALNATLTAKKVFAERGLLPIT